jgi:hypothetical protein
MHARVSQTAVEAAIDEGTIETFARVSQESTEAMGLPVANARVSQEAIELLATKIFPPIGGSNVRVYES